MRTISTIMLILLVWTVNANNFKTAMTDALKSFQACKSIADYKEVANTFQRIANAETSSWLPLYYHAQSYIMMSFSSREDAAQRDAYLDEAQKSVDAMLLIDSEESEIYALQSLLQTARLVIDPMNRGQKMMLASAESIQKSFVLNPNNPRAIYMQLSNEVGMAQFFGKDPSEYCERITALYNNWDGMNEVPELYPSWGKGSVKELMTNCK